MQFSFVYEALSYLQTICHSPAAAFRSGCRAIFVSGEIDETKCGAGRFRYVEIPV